MLKFRLVPSNGKPPTEIDPAVVSFVIDDENVKRLLQGMPIRITGAHVGIPATTIYIVYAKDLREAARELGLPEVH